MIRRLIKFWSAAQDLSDAGEREKERVRAQHVDERTWQLKLELQAMTTQDHPQRTDRAQ